VQPVERAVVQLDPARIDAHSTVQRLSRLSCAMQRTADDHIGTWQPVGERRGLPNACRGQRRVGAAEQLAAPVGLRLAMTHEQQHRLTL
jgi:hypothetical protein